MNYLGVDYGDKKIGLSISPGKLAEPYRVIRYTDEESAFEEIAEILEKEKIDEVVVGLSENESFIKAKRFGQKIDLELDVHVEFVDETLSTHDAQMLSLESGMNRKKRKNLEDAFAATLILQKYLDGLKN